MPGIVAKLTELLAGFKACTSLGEDTAEILKKIDKTEKNSRAGKEKGRGITGIVSRRPSGCGGYTG
ncbi:MAG: hypothetical protein ACLTK0_07295 [Anaerovoracaceae bacterium]